MLNQKLKIKETIEEETRKQEEGFYKLALKYREIDVAATEQKKQNYLIDLFDEIENKDNSFNDGFKTEDISIDDDMFDDTDQKEKKRCV